MHLYFQNKYSLLKAHAKNETPPPITPQESPSTLNQSPSTFAAQKEEIKRNQQIFHFPRTIQLQFQTVIRKIKQSAINSPRSHWATHPVYERHDRTEQRSLHPAQTGCSEKSAREFRIGRVNLFSEPAAAVAARVSGDSLARFPPGTRPRREIEIFELVKK